MQYFEEEMNDTRNRMVVRKKAEDLHEKIQNALFMLYLLFLQHNLEALAGINKQLQNANMSVYTAYCKIMAFKNTFMEQILHDPSKDICDSNLLPFDSATQVFWGDEFQSHLKQCTEHALLTEWSLQQAKKNMYTYLNVIGMNIENRFPEIDFMTTQFSFIEPNQRQLHQCNMSIIVSQMMLSHSTNHYYRGNTGTTVMIQP